jgi:acyl-CoA thioester hydrolase
MGASGWDGRQIAGSEADIARLLSRWSGVATPPRRQRWSGAIVAASGAPDRVERPTAATGPRSTVPPPGARFPPRCRVTARELTGRTVRDMVRRVMSSPVIIHEDIVRPEWIDSNGHLNLAYYVVVFDLATDKLYAHLGIGDDYRAATGNSCFTAETHTIYEREVRLDEKLLVHTWLLGADAKRLHYFHEMFHVGSGERSAVQELMALHIDMRLRRVAPFPEDRRLVLAEMVDRYAPATLPKGAGRKIMTLR